MTLSIAVLALASVISGACAGVVGTLITIAATEARRNALGTEHHPRGSVAASVVTVNAELASESGAELATERATRALTGPAAPTL